MICLTATLIDKKDTYYPFVISKVGTQDRFWYIIVNIQFALMCCYIFPLDQTINTDDI